VSFHHLLYINPFTYKLFLIFAWFQTSITQFCVQDSEDELDDIDNDDSDEDDLQMDHDPRIKMQQMQPANMDSDNDFWLR